MQKECPTHALRQYVQLSKGTMVIIYIYIILAQEQSGQNTDSASPQNL